MATIFKFLCQKGHEMTYRTSSREYVCHGRDHSVWECKPTYQLRDGVKYPITQAPKLPTGTFKK